MVTFQYKWRHPTELSKSISQQIYQSRIFKKTGLAVVAIISRDKDLPHSEYATAYLCFVSQAAKGKKVVN